MVLSFEILLHFVEKLLEAIQVDLMRVSDESPIAVHRLVTRQALVDHAEQAFTVDRLLLVLLGRGEAVGAYGRPAALYRREWCLLNALVGLLYLDGLLNSRIDVEALLVEVVALRHRRFRHNSARPVLKLHAAMVIAGVLVGSHELDRVTLMQISGYERVLVGPELRVHTAQHDVARLLRHHRRF